MYHKKVIFILVIHRMVGGLLTLSPQYCFVIENTEGEVCGYVLSALDAKAFLQQAKMAWIPEMQTKYPKPEPSSTYSPAQVSPVQYLILIVWLHLFKTVQIIRILFSAVQCAFQFNAKW